MAYTRKVGRALQNDEVVDIFEVLPSDVSDLSEFESDSGNEAVCSCSAIANSDSESEKNDPPQQTEPQRKKLRTDLFQWRRGNFVPKNHTFIDEISGISVNINDDCTVFDIFGLFFPLHIMQHISDEINKYYIFLSKKLAPSLSSRLQSWKNTTPEELYVFFAVTMLMSRVKKLKITEYWSKDPLISTHQFTAYMSRDRYLLLLRLLHFNENETQIPGDRLYKLIPIVDHLKNVFSEVFTPFQNICIDESLTLFKGRVLFL
jgi:hypothetical protein